ncbi:hypothetical protein WJX79_004772 [Trebouxia sp. C0005]
MGRNTNYNYAHFNNTGTNGSNANNRASNKGGGGGGAVFSRLGNQNSFQALADNAPAPGRIAFGGKGGQHNSGGNQQDFSQAHNLGHSQRGSHQVSAGGSPANVSRSQQKRSQHRGLLKDQIEDGLTQHVPTTWKMTCFSVAEAMPEDLSYQPRVKNEVNGDVSFEEVRWADYQEPNKHVCIARFAEANRQKHLQFEALKRCQLAPSAGGPPLPEPASPYVLSALPGAFGSAAAPAPSGAPSQLVPSGPFAHAQPNPFGGAGSFGPSGQQPFGVPAQPQMPPPAQPSQPGRIQFGQKAGQPASNPFAGGSSQPGQPFGSQSRPSQPFRTPFNSTQDPFGRQKSGQAQQAAQQSPSSNPFNNQQQLPATPAPFGAFGGPQSGLSQPPFGQSFQTPAVQQRPAFAGGITISPQTPMPGV